MTHSAKPATPDAIDRLIDRVEAFLKAPRACRPDSRPRARFRACARMTPVRMKLPRVICGARRHRDGQPCEAKSEPGKRRCRFHGGRSTGPKTPAGKARALANLRQYRATPSPSNPST